MVRTLLALLGAMGELQASKAADVALQTLTRLQVKGLYQQLAAVGLVEKSVQGALVVVGVYVILARYG